MKSYAIGETMSDVDSLSHFGRKGMKWGVRRGKKVTGVSRTAGARIDRNDIGIKKVQKLAAGLENNSGSLGTKSVNAANRLLIGKEATAQKYETSIATMQKQNARLTSGKATVRDRLSAGLAVTSLDLIVSVRPRN